MTDTTTISNAKKIEWAVKIVALIVGGFISREVTQLDDQLKTIQNRLDEIRAIDKRVTRLEIIQDIGNGQTSHHIPNWFPYGDEMVQTKEIDIPKRNNDG